MLSHPLASLARRLRPLLSAVILLTGFSEIAASQASSAAVSIDPPVINGVIDGSIQQLRPKNANLNSQGFVTGKWFVPGSPKLRKNGYPTFGGKTVGHGSPHPKNYRITLNHGSYLGGLVTHTDATPLPSVPAPLAPSGHKWASLNPGSHPGDLSNVRGINLNSHFGNLDLPPGVYGSVNLNHGTSLTLGTPGATTPDTYSFIRLNLNGYHSRIIIAGPVKITVKRSLILNHGTFLGDPYNPSWLDLRLSHGHLRLNGASCLYGSVLAPNNQIHINEHSILCGNARGKKIIINNCGLLIVKDAATPPTNTAPSASALTLSIAEDTPLAITLAGTDSELDPLTFSIQTQPTQGTLSGTAPNLTYTPASNFTGSDAFTYTVSDSLLESPPATVSITVTNVNDPPIAAPADLTTDEDTPLPIILAASDLDTDPLTFTITTAPENGTLTGTAPDLTYTPTANFFGTDTFAFTASDADLDSAPATVTITVTPTNDAPEATDLALETPEDSSVSITLIGSDTENDPLSFTILSDPTSGTLSGTAPNLTYTPTANFSGEDTFTFTTNDGTLDSSPATVTITVTPINDPPLANTLTAETAEDTPLTITLAGSDPENDPLTFTITTPPANGALSGTAPNLTYTPDPNFNGSDTFAYTTSDSTLSSAPATATILVTPVNDAPIATPLALTIPEDSSLPILLVGTDADDDPLTFTLLTQPTTGTLTGTAPDLTYTPEPEFSGTTSFTYLTNDGTTDSTPGTVTITVTPVNDIPIALSQETSTFEDTPIPLFLEGSDPEGSPITFRIVDLPATGTAEIIGTGPGANFTPEPEFSGEVTFTFVTNDGESDSLPATVTIFLASANDPPVAIDATYTTPQEFPLPITLSATDAENDPVTYTIVDAPSTGTLTGNAPALTYTPATGFVGTDTFTYHASDSLDQSEPATITITVTGRLTANITSPENGSTYLLGETITLAAIAADPSSTITTLTLFSDGTQVAASSSATASTSLTDLEVGTHTFTATATNAASDTSDAPPITITIAESNLPPIVNAGPDQQLPSPSQPGPNLIQNPGAEKPATNGEIPAWTLQDGAPWTAQSSATDGFPPSQDGGFYFASTFGAYTEIYQDIDVTRYSSGFDSGSGWLRFSAYIRVQDERTLRDDAGVLLEFRDVTGNTVLETRPLRPGIGADRWFPVDELIRPPVGTRSVRIRLCGKLAGSDQLTGAFFDALALRAVPGTATLLSGGVEDDGLPRDSALESTWSLVSGPAAAIPALSASLETPTALPLSGTYTFALSVSDGELSARDQVVVEVGSPDENRPPVVEAGSDQEITFPVRQLNLVGTVEDDAFPGTSLTTEWVVIDGPDEATFSAPTTLATSVRFSAAGNYTLRLYASDGLSRTYDDITVRVLCAEAATRVDVALVVDVSGSMSSRIAGARDALNSFVDTTFPGETRAALIAYESTARVVVPFESESQILKDGIATLSAGGGTNTESGLRAAQTEFAENGRPGSERVVVVLGDGDGGGLLAAEELKAEGVRIITIWVGGGATGTFEAIASTPDDFYPIASVDENFAIDEITQAFCSFSSGDLTAYAGGNQTTTAPAQVSLSASYIARGIFSLDPSTVISRWEVLDAPFPVTISNPDELNTGVEITQPGTYSFQFVVENEDASIQRIDVATVFATAPCPLLEGGVTDGQPIAWWTAETPVERITDRFPALGTPRLAYGEGISGSAFIFDGPTGASSTELAYRDPEFFEALTTPEGSVEFWFKVDDFENSTDLLFSCFSESDSLLWMFTEPGSGASRRLGFTVRDEEGRRHTATTTATLRVDTWHHAALTWNVETSEFRLYLDGRFETSQVRTHRFLSEAVEARIGGSKRSREEFDGSMDEFKVFGSRRDAIAIARAAEQPVPAFCTNAPPIVDAGGDETAVELGNALLLSGTVSDDGNPNASSLVTSWSQLSGPGSTTFADATSPETVATFDTPGIYVLELSATDGEFSQSDTISVRATDSGVICSLPAGAALAAPLYWWDGANFEDRIQGLSLEQLTTRVVPALVPGASGTAFGSSSGAITFRSSENLVLPPIETGFTCDFWVYTPEEMPASNTRIELRNRLNAIIGTDRRLRLDGQIFTLIPSRWHHVLYTYDPAASLRTIYIDGRTGFTVEGPPSTSPLGYAEIKVATNSIEESTAIDELRVFGRHFTYEDVIALHSCISARDYRDSNTPPQVDAGSPALVYLDRPTIALQGSAIDDGNPGESEFTTSWLQLSGPGTGGGSDSPVIADQSLPNTSVVFSAAGDYIFELSATDGEYRVFDTVAIRVFDSCSVDMQRGLLGWWRGENSTVDEVSGTYAPYYNFRLGTIGYDHGKVGQAFAMTGESAVEIQKDESWNPQEESGFSYEFWMNASIREDSFYSYSPLVFSSPNPSSGRANTASISILGDKSEFRSWAFEGNFLGNDRVRLTPAALPIPDTWHHIAFTYDKKTGDTRAYLDGVAVASGTGIPGENIQYDRNIHLGGTAFSDFDGLIDEFAIYNRALSASEIASIAGVGEKGKCPLISNDAPIVKAGSDFSISQTSSISLRGTVADDGVPADSQLSSMWSTVSSPDGAIVTFADPESPQTAVDVTLEGTYEFSLSATDGRFASKDSVLVRVSPGCINVAQDSISGWWRGDGSPLPTIGSSAIQFGLFNTPKLSEIYGIGNTGEGFELRANDELIIEPTEATDASASTNGFSAEYWFRQEETNPAVRSFMSWFAPGSSTATVQLRKQFSSENAELVTLELTIRDPSDGRTTRFESDGNLPMAANSFHHIAFVFEPLDRVATVYLDGISVVTAPFADIPFVSSGQFTIGRGFSSARPAVFDEITLYSKSLTEAEISAIYGAGMSGRCFTLLENQPPVADAGLDSTLEYSSSSISEAFRIPTGRSQAFDVDYLEGSDGIRLSRDWSQRNRSNYYQIFSNGSQRQFSFRTFGSGSHPSTYVPKGSTGFEEGALYYGISTGGQIIRFTPDGTSSSSPIRLDRDTGAFRGLAFGNVGSPFAGQLIGATALGNVWSFAPDHTGTLLASIGVPLESVYIVPDDTEHFGPWAGKILVASESTSMLYTVAPDGTTATYDLGVSPGDINAILAGQNFYVADYTGTNLLGIPSQIFSGLSSNLGDLLITDTSTSTLNHVRWDLASSSFITSALLAVPAAQLEGGTFAPVGISPFGAPGSPSVTLTGNVSDDGLPLISRLTQEWQLLEGSAPVAFSSPRETATAVAFSQPGVYTFGLIASDGELAGIDETTVTITSAGNLPPVVSAGEDRTLSLPPSGASLTLAGIATDDGSPAGGTLTTTWRILSGVENGAAILDPATLGTEASFTLPGTYVLELSASDGTLTVADTITVTAVIPDNSPPVITVTNPPILDLVASDTATLTASITDDGFPIGSSVTTTWRLLSGFTGVSIASPAAAKTAVTITTPGTYTFEISASDGALSTHEEVTLVARVPENTAPTVDAGSDLFLDLSARATVTLEGAAMDDGLPLGSSLMTAWRLSSGFTGSSIVEPFATTTEVSFTNPGTYIFTLEASDGARITADTVTVTVAQSPLVNWLAPFSGTLFTLEETVSLQAQALPRGGTLESVSFLVAGTPSSQEAILTDPTIGLYTIALPAGRLDAGTHTLSLTATGAGGLSSTTNAITIAVLADPDAPLTLEITSPTDSQNVTAPTDVVGTVSGDLVSGYTLDFRSCTGLPEAAKPAWQTFATGSGEVTDGLLGQFDPTLLENGVYEIRLGATTIAGTVAYAPPVPILVDSQMKIGHFSLAFEDLSVPLFGYPLTVTRTYDSRDTTQGDFGTGWQLGTKDIRLIKNRPLGEGWSVEVGVTQPPGFNLQFFYYCLQPDARKVVSIIMPDDQVLSFEGRFTTPPTTQRFVPDDTCALAVRPSQAKLEFRALGDTVGTLEPVDPTYDPPLTNVVFSGGLNQNDDGVVALNRRGEYPSKGLPNLDPIYEPTTFRYRTPDGQIFLIDEQLGLLSMTDRNGNTVTFGENGYTHTDDQGNTTSSIAFTRNTQGNIETITDPDGDTLTYTYDSQSRLSTFTNRVGDVTTYLYEEPRFPNYLTTILDPRGIPAIKSFYDDDGRLVRQEDAEGNEITFNHDIPNRRETVTDRLGNSTIHEYDLDGNVTTTTNREGETTTYTYYPDTENEHTVTDDLGNVITRTYDSENRVLTESTGQDGAYTTTTAYNSDGNPTSITDPSGRQTTFTYSATNANLLSMTQGETTEASAPSQFPSPTSQTLFTYEENGELATIIDAEGNITATTYAYLPDFTAPYPGIVRRVTTTVTDASGTTLQRSEDYQDVDLKTLRTIAYRTLPDGTEEAATTDMVYDSEDRVIATILPDGRVQETRYNSISKEAASLLWRNRADFDSGDDTLARATTMAYDARGNLTLTTYPDGTTSSADYDQENRQLYTQDQEGHRTFMSYDKEGRLRYTFHPDSTPEDLTDNPFTETQYDTAGRVKFQIDELGNRTEFTYETGYGAADRRAQVIQHRTALPDLITSYQYDTTGNVRFLTDPRGNTTESIYDTQNRPVETIFPATSQHPITTAEIRYDTLGRRTHEIDQEGRGRKFHYDALGRLIQVDYIDNDEAETVVTSTTYAYDQAGNLHTQTDAKGNATQFRYDIMGRRTARILPNGDTETMSYDPWGQMASKTDFNGHTITYLIDDMGRLEFTEVAAGHPSLALPHAPKKHAFTYYNDGQRETQTITNAAGNILHQETYTYDERNRLLTKESPQGTLTYTYFANSLLKSVTSSNAQGIATTYLYDELNRLEFVTDNRFDPTSPTQYTYDPNGNLQGTLYPNQVAHTYQYDTLNRLKNLTIGTPTTPQQSYTYALKPTGHRETITELSGRTATHTYDALYRLTSETISGDLANQNGTTSYGLDSTGNRESRTSTVPALDDQTFAYTQNDHIDGVDYTYDPNGNTTASTRGTDVYDYNNRLIQRTQPDGTTIDLLYNTDGVRISKFVSRFPSPGSPPQATILTEYHTCANNHTGYAQVYEELKTTGTATQYLATVYHFGHDLIAIDQRETALGDWEQHFYSYDGLGSIRALTDSSGQQTDTYTYDAFGIELASTGTTPNAYRYTGEQFDTDLGQYYLRARYLDPNLARFWSMDTFEGGGTDPATLHKYLYGNHNPSSNVDHSGNFFTDIVTSLYVRTVLLAAAHPILTNVAVGTLTVFQVAAFMSNEQYRNDLIGSMGPTQAAALVTANVRALTSVGRSIYRGLSGSYNLRFPTKFGNQFPSHPTGPIIQEFSPAQITRSTFTRKVNYVVLPDGRLVLGRINGNSVGGGHIDLANGGPVTAAGEAFIQNGRLISVNNSSGHYIPFGNSARIAATRAFNSAGFSRVPYVETVYNGQKWIPLEP